MFKSNKIPAKPRPITIHEDDAIHPARIRRCVSAPELIWDLPSIMKCRTLDESLHSTWGSESGGSHSEKRTSFDSVIIREYARTVGDNPSCSSGPPIGISWDYNHLGVVQLDDFENARPPRRSNFEMVLPRKLRHDMLRREWNVSQKQLAEAVRRNVRVKNQRKATVNNLGKATRMEELLESAQRKIVRTLTFQKPVSVQVKALEAKMNEAARRRSQLRLQLQMASEFEQPESSTGSSSQKIPDAVGTSRRSM